MTPSGARCPATEEPRGRWTTCWTSLATKATGALASRKRVVAIAGSALGEVDLLAAERPEVEQHDLAAEVGELDLLTTGVEPAASDQLRGADTGTAFRSRHAGSQQQVGRFLFLVPRCGRRAGPPLGGVVSQPGLAWRSALGERYLRPCARLASEDDEGIRDRVHGGQAHRGRPAEGPARP